MGLAFLSPWFLLGALAVALPIAAAPAQAGHRAGARVRRHPLPAPRAGRGAAAAPAARPAAAGAARRGAGAAGRGVRPAVHPRRGRRRRRSPSSRWTRRSAWARRAAMAKAKDAALRRHRRRARRRSARRSSASTIAPPSSPSRASTAARPGPPSRRSPPGSGGTALTPLWSAATRLAGAAKGRLVLISDLEVEYPAGAIADGLTLDVVDVGGPVENLAVGPARREADAAGRRSDQPRHPAARDAGRACAVNDRSVADAAVDDRAGRGPRRCGWRRGCRRAGVARISVTDTDGIPADDTRYLVLDAPPLATVALLGEAGLGRRSRSSCARRSSRAGRAAASRSRCWAATPAARSARRRRARAR